MNGKFFLSRCVFLFVVVILTPIFSFAQKDALMSRDLNGLAKLRGYSSKRISSFDRTGKNADRLKIESGEVAPIAEIEGAGIIKHIWVTISCSDKMIRRNAILRMYWDGEDQLEMAFCGEMRKKTRNENCKIQVRGVYGSHPSHERDHKSIFGRPCLAWCQF